MCYESTKVIIQVIHFWFKRMHRPAIKNEIFGLGVFSKKFYKFIFGKGFLVILFR